MREENNEDRVCFLTVALVCQVIGREHPLSEAKQGRKDTGFRDVSENSFQRVQSQSYMGMSFNWGICGDFHGTPNPFEGVLINIGSCS